MSLLKNAHVLTLNEQSNLLRLERIKLLIQVQLSQKKKKKSSLQVGQPEDIPPKPKRGKSFTFAGIYSEP